MCDICFDNFYMLSTKQALKLSKDLNIDGVVNDAISQLFEDGKIDRKTKKQLFLSHNAPLQKAVEEGFGKELAKIEYGTPNYEFLKQLQTNTAVFAMFKNHASMKDMAALLKDAEGNLRTKESFKTEALKKDATYRKTWLDAEYDTAVRQARMASQWKKIQENKHLYPNLKYLLTKASKPDEAHLKYVGIILPVDHPFWQTHYPPNRIRCQCGVEQTDDDATDLPDNLPELPDDFKFNAGASGQIFDFENSSYIKSASAREIPGLIKEAKKIFNFEAAVNAGYQPIAKGKNGGLVSAHPLAFNNGDFDEAVAKARYLAKQGTKVKILPELAEKSIREKLMPKGVKGLRNPDYLIDGEFVADLKTLEESTQKAVHGAFSRCFKQCDNIVLEIPSQLSITSQELYQFTKGKLSHKSYQKFENVWIDFKGKLYKTTREEIVKGIWYL